MTLPAFLRPPYPIPAHEVIGAGLILFFAHEWYEAELHARAMESVALLNREAREYCVETMGARVDSIAGASADYQAWVQAVLGEVDNDG